MSKFKRIRLYLLIALCAAPMMFGSEPSEPCSESMISGHVRTASGANAAGVVVSLEYFTEDVVMDADYLIRNYGEGCGPDFTSIRARDTTDSTGSFSFLVQTEYSFRNEVDVADSFRILVTLPNDSVITGLIFSEADTTSIRPIHYQSRSGSGCECSPSPDTYLAGYTYFYNDRIITLP